MSGAAAVGGTGRLMTQNQKGTSGGAVVNMTEFSHTSSAVQANGTITWTGDVASGAQVVIISAATVGTTGTWYGQPVINDATDASINAGSGVDSGVFTIVEAPEAFYVHLPVVAKEH